MPARATRILRLLEDYTPDPSAPSQEKFSKKDLLLEVGEPKNGWVMVKQLRLYNSVPGWVPEKLVTNAAPGFYRMRQNMEFGRTRVARGRIVKVLDNECKRSLFAVPLTRKNLFQHSLTRGSMLIFLIVIRWLDLRDAEAILRHEPVGG